MKTKMLRIVTERQVLRDIETGDRDGHAGLSVRRGDMRRLRGMRRARGQVLARVSEIV